MNNPGITKSILNAREFVKLKKQSITGSLLPLLLLSGLFHLMYLATSANRPDYLLTQSGEYTIWALLLSLACTPLTIVFGWQGLRRTRKYVGIFAFVFGAIHLLSFLPKFQWEVMPAIRTIASELNLLLASGSFVIMLALFVTSNRPAIRNLRKLWKPLHRLVYPAAILGSLHGILINDQFSPHGMKYLVLVLVLLIIRTPAVKRYFLNRRIPQRQTAIQRGMRMPEI